MKILLTSAGFNNKRIGQKFLELLGKPACDAKVLFIPKAATAAINEWDGATHYVEECKKELIEHGIAEENLCTYEFEYRMSEDEALSYDVIYFTGGYTHYLLAAIKENEFGFIIQRMISNNKIYIGVSAGSIIMTPNISLDNPFDSFTEALGYLPAFLSVHCNDLNQYWFKKTQKKLNLPLIALNDTQAILINEDGYFVIE